jgi:hypothetical protein
VCIAGGGCWKASRLEWGHFLSSDEEAAAHMRQVCAPGIGPGMVTRLSFFLLFLSSDEAGHILQDCAPGIEPGMVTLWASSSPCASFLHVFSWKVVYPSCVGSVRLRTSLLYVFSGKVASPPGFRFRTCVFSRNEDSHMHPNWRLALNVYDEQLLLRDGREDLRDRISRGEMVRNSFKLWVVRTV